MTHPTSSILFAVLVFFSPLFLPLAKGQATDTAVETVEIKKKMYPKAKKFQLSADFGKILNQSYVSSNLIHFNGTYFLSETSGFTAEFALSLNSDEAARTCVENFYNDPDGLVSAECALQDGQADLEGASATRATVGPAYPAIREIKNIITAGWVWVPVYGKQLFFMSGVSHFDVYTTLGGGVMMSDYYEQKKTSSNGKPYRGAFPNKDNPGSAETPGVSETETSEYGKAGRPTPVAATSPLITAGIGQQFHFGKTFSVKLELRNYTLIGVPGFIDMYFAIWGGAALRF